jgi:hypothetical protein
LNLNVFCHIFIPSQIFCNNTLALKRELAVVRVPFHALHLKQSGGNCKKNNASLINLELLDFYFLPERQKQDVQSFVP